MIFCPHVIVVWGYNTIFNENGQHFPSSEYRWAQFFYDLDLLGEPMLKVSQFDG